MPLRPPAFLLCAVSLCAVSLSAAADGATLASPRASARAPEAAEQTLGVGLGVGPGYLGAANTIGRVGLVAEANFHNGVFVSTTDGVGFRLPTHASGWSLAASLGGSGERREKDGEDGARNRLKGMGKVDNRAQANVFLNYDAGRYHATAQLRQTLGGRRGSELDVIGRYDLLADADNLLEAFAGFSYANRSLMQTYFGVTAAQSASSGNAAYTPRAGVAGAGLGLTWRHAFNREWVGTLGAGATLLRGAAADSPLTERRANAAAGASVAYRF